MMKMLNFKWSINEDLPPTVHHAIHYSKHIYVYKIYKIGSLNQKMNFFSTYNV